ncbi:V-type proton ATPase subunit S1-like [Acipenser oxyrinchus oxyrinchus]|uniref:V-type proton ATPase subunit S1-like n=1 Tax=Acipenser oxyrinchus oxyrinchus TaxID=40147 RepID=A0AAD8DD14_ACIOX|nr:V-type proton ATPase subunit S1-like [Acipenser oxyrinchus oxyrinchus]
MAGVLGVIFTCILVKSILRASTAVDHVPVLIWSTQSSLWKGQLFEYEGHIISEQELHNLLQPLFNQSSRNIVLFLQDKLSMDDFTYYRRDHANEKPFHSLQISIETSASSLVLPAVTTQGSSHLSEYLQKQTEWNIFTADHLPIEDLDIDPSKPNLFLVNLPVLSSTSDESRAHVLANNDLTMGKFTTNLKNLGIPFTAIYTAFSPSKGFKSTDMTSHTGRQLLAVDIPAPARYSPLTVTNGTYTCIIMFATKVALTFKNTLHVDLTNETFVSHTVNSTSSECSDTNTLVSLKYSNPAEGINTLELRFLMTNKFYKGSARKWFTFDSLEIIQDNLHTARFNASISAPAEYSYHCQLVGTNMNYASRFIPANKEAQAWEIHISDFQIQGFNIKNNMFSYASDCASFFTPGIWMGLMSTFLMLSILYYGLLMIMQLTTNDRFDDPKGAAIFVPQTN